MFACINIILLILCVCHAYDIEDFAAESRIANGTDAKEDEFPYAVSLRINSSHTCGGTILNEKFILTAAHCVCANCKPQNSNFFSIQYDVLQITNDSMNSINVKKIHCHKYDSDKNIYDVAVLELEKPIPKGKWSPVKMANHFVAEEDLSGTIIGWGRLSQDGPRSKTLQKMKVEIYNDETCAKEFDTVHHICFGAPVGGACKGDSGSPLIVEGIQVGIASFITDNCGIANRQNPNVYSRVSTYHDWISGITGLDKS
ncbi:chymotrypsin-2-like [Anoplophora glabripennis]|uniref:chymotrypsin-2-like n=1 Tax=Anoplophora glabripennis TaxID=217634 RepID=UPI000874EB21|nr:chymotrypsin-2-like [Anoplophora glabripennis]